MTDEESEKNYHSGLPGFLGTIDNAISKLEAAILAVGVLLMAANTIINVIGRFVFGESIFFSGELNRILIIMITFAGIGYAARHGRHIRMFCHLRCPAGRWAPRPDGGHCPVHLTGDVLFALLLSDLHPRPLRQGAHPPALGIPIFWIYLWVPLGFLITGIQYLLTAIKNLTSHDVYLSTGVVDGYKDTETEV